MPAINVAKTDTFEVQRQKINQIGSQIFSISQGGSDLSTGLLKLGDGTRQAPSLAFIDESKLGLYRPSVSTIGIVGQDQKLVDFSTTEGFVSYKDSINRKNVLVDTGIVVNNSGSNYDEGSYTNVSLIGGTGEGGTVDITVVGFSGTVTNAGSDYISGQFAGIPLLGGSGSGAEAGFFSEDFTGSITNVGSGYPPGAYIVDVTGGSGSNATANISISGSATLTGSITDAGSGLTDGTYGQVQLFNDPLQTFVITAVPNPDPNAGQNGIPNNVYQVDGVTQPQLDLIKGNTYHFDMSDASATGHPLYFQDTSGNVVDTNYYSVTTVGNEGQAGAFVELVIFPNAPDAAIIYNCIAHNGMGAQINLYVPGALGAPAGGYGQYGRNASADITVTGGVVTGLTFTNSGQGYAENDILVIPIQYIGGTGVNAEYTLGPPIYTGTVDSFVISNPGNGYLQGDVVSFSNSDTSNYGSGFQFTVSSNPGAISQFEISTYGSGYQVGDVLTFPVGKSNVSTYLPGPITGLSTTLSTASTSITVSSTTGIFPGMTVFSEQGSIGQLDQGVTVDSVPNSTTVVLTLAPIIDGTATLTFQPTNTLEITVADASGISAGDLVQQTGGTGVLASGTTVSSVNTNTNVVSLSQQPTTPGTATLNFTPSFGTSSNPFSYRVDALGAVSLVTINEDGNGYFPGDTFSVNPSNLTQDIEKTVTAVSTQSLTFNGSVSSGALSVGDTIKKPDGEIIVFQVVATNPGPTSVTYSNLSASGGTGIGAVFDVERAGDGTATLSLVDGGTGYTVTDTLTIPGNLVGGATPADDITITVDSTVQYPELEVYAIDVTGGNISEVSVEFDLTASFVDGDIVVFSGTGNTTYTINTAGTEKGKFVIDGDYVPDLTLYEGSNYLFDTSGLNNHEFGFSTFPGGQYAPSLVAGVGTTLATSSKQITVASTTGISAGMVVTSSGVGVVEPGTLVESVDSATQLTLSEFPSAVGAATLTFAGTEYNDGVTPTATGIQLKVTENTPTLYYYCKSIGDTHTEMGVAFGTPAVVTIDPNNPKTFGSGFVLEAFEVSSEDVIKADVVEGKFTALEIEAPIINSEFTTVSNTLTSPNSTLTTIGGLTTLNTFGATTNVNMNGGAFNFNTGSIELQDATLTTQILLSDNGNIDSPNGTVTAKRFSTPLNALTLENNEIESTSDIVLRPSFADTVFIDSAVALRLPVGDTNARPTLTSSDYGYVRFNTDTDQYEGFSATTNSWSSLGGVRDLDGNTTILAEASVGANDNTLWFINDSVNTVKFTPTHQEFVNVKRVRSVNTSAPVYTTWTANSPVTAGQYLKYRNNIFVVITSGTTATSGSEPTNTTGNTFTNGSSELQYFTSAVSTLTFEEISELRVDPLGFTDLVVNNELRFSNNEISTESQDLSIKPYPGQKVVITAPTSLVIPVGDNNSKGNPSQGSIRYNTDITQFEGYNGAQWSSLGGVRDVDGNTYIIPETSPGSNENILYFYNNNSNTLRVTETQMEFDTIDTIASSGGTLNLNASLVTFNNLDTSLDNTASDTTFISTTKDKLDFGLASGLFNDHLLRLQDNGDIYYNLGFGTGTPNNVRLFDTELKTVEMAEFKIESGVIELEKGLLDTGNSVVYNPTNESSAKIILTAINTTSGDKELVEYFVTHTATDTFFTDSNNVKTGSELISSVFDFDGNGNVRISVTLDSGLTAGDIVNVTLVKTITKR